MQHRRYSQSPHLVTSLLDSICSTLSRTTSTLTHYKKKPHINELIITGVIQCLEVELGRPRERKWVLGMAARLPQKAFAREPAERLLFDAAMGRLWSGVDLVGVSRLLLRRIASRLDIRHFRTLRIRRALTRTLTTLLRISLNPHSSLHQRRT